MVAGTTVDTTRMAVVAGTHGTIRRPGWSAMAMAMAMDRLEYNPIKITDAREVEIVDINEVDDE